MKENHLIAIYFAVIIILLVSTMVYRQEIDGVVDRKSVV